MTQKAIELKPCPFCGKNATYGKMKAKRCQLHGDKIPQGTFVACPSKHAQIAASTQEEAFKKWNSRAALSAPTMLVDAEKIVHAFAEDHDSDGFLFNGDEYDIELLKFAFEWFFSGNSHRLQSLRTSQPKERR